MKGFNSEQTLWAIFPMILVVILLIAGIIFLPQTQNDVRSRASEPKPTIVTPPPAKPTETNLEIVCSDLYSPVCGIDGKTYINACEASLAQVLSFYPGTCNTTPTPSLNQKPVNNLQYTLPSSN